MCANVQPEEFAERYNVPRGTMAHFARYAALLSEWQEKINLVGPRTLDDVWNRHFADSAQLIRWSRPGKHWVDVGSGAGFPGMVLALLRWGNVTLVESVGKKARFLEAVKNELALPNVEIRCARAEDLPPLRADIGTARACAPLLRLLQWIPRHVVKEGRFVFPKGKNWAKEVEEAQKNYSFTLKAQKSETDEDARVLLLRNLKRIS